MMSPQILLLYATKPHIVQVSGAATHSRLAISRAIRHITGMNSDVFNPAAPFRPPLWMRSAMAQTALASQKFRKSGTHLMEQVAEERILTCRDAGGNPVKLMGQYSRAVNPRALMILLHGWEGSQDSTYVMSHGRFLFDQGVSIFRLNNRDHGPTHHLNEGIFNSTLFAEVFDAVQQIAEGEAVPAFLIGFSLGGNFALRIARALKDAPIPNLAHIISVSPVIDPVAAAPMVDVNALIRRYFLKKWSASLVKKQAAFPELYDFGDVSRFKTVAQMSESFLPNYTEFATPDDYFTAYRIWQDDLATCETPLSIIMAKDDPVLPAADVLPLTLHENSRLFYLDHGGHNGFFASLRGPTWYDSYVQTLLPARD